MTGALLRRLRERCKLYVSVARISDISGLSLMTVQSTEARGKSWSKTDARRNAYRQANWRAIIAAIRVARKENAKWRP